MPDQTTPASNHSASDGGAASVAGKAAAPLPRDSKEPPWGPTYDAWLAHHAGVPSWFVVRPSARKYIANLVLAVYLVVVTVWGLLMPADQNGYIPWHFAAMGAFALVAFCHLLFALATMTNKRVIVKIKVLLPHLVLVIACVVMFLLVFFKLGHSEPAGPARVIMVYATSAVAVVYVLWLLGLFLWRKVGVRFELHKNSLVVRKGIFGRSEDETPLVRVNDVSVKRTFTQRILGVCTVDVISTDSTDVDRTNDEQRKLLGLKSGEGVLELMDMPKLLPKATEELRKQIRAAAEEKKLPIDDAHFGGGEVDQVIQNRMHWIREHILVVVDSGN